MPRFYAGWIGCEDNPKDDTVDGLAWRQRYGDRAADFR